MKRNLVIFVIVLVLFIVIALVGYLIFMFQSRLLGSTTSSPVSSQRRSAGPPVGSPVRRVVREAA
ncbi:hypothetical protein NA57DRAFT_77137 [Rhizodiscina lignyota]|uniref:Uncharacterized protein n=1 Tax=Rhizodiscina lignyota TaxID=1504668 RepID=A0A9P4IET9_9PEZI|nr:hypothetical protein NA57DRAFT_77137 [Rhizodiscina lignyota]